MKLACCLFLATGCVAPSIAGAQPYQPLGAVKPLTGYACMSLNLTEQQMMDPSVHVPIRSSPSAEAPVTGNAVATVIAKSPEQQENGFLQVLQLDGRVGWVEAQFLKPWKNPGGNGQRCYPAMMSNGRVGFNYR